MSVKSSFFVSKGLAKFGLLLLMAYSYSILMSSNYASSPHDPYSASSSEPYSGQFEYFATDLMTKAFQKQQGVRLEWVIRPPKKVKIGQPFTVKWRLYAGTWTHLDHLNLHACPKRYGRVCRKGQDRQDGAVISGPVKEYYQQTFAFKKGTLPGRYILSGHMQSGKHQALTTKGADLKPDSAIVTVIK